MAQVCVGNSKLERHCSKESAEQDQDKKAACSLEEEEWRVRGEYTAVMQGRVEDGRKEKKLGTITGTICSSRHVMPNILSQKSVYFFWCRSSVHIKKPFEGRAFIVLMHLSKI